MQPSYLRSKLEAIWGVKKEFRLKVFLLTLSYFFLTATQAIWRPLKSSVFMSIVGVKYIPDAKFYLMLPLIILIIIYSKLVDWLRRHHLFYLFAISHGLVGIILYFYLAHPIYGVENTFQDSSRVLGWVFYLFMESFGAFMSATFWAFANSVNNPKDAKNYYSIFASGSKIGGIIAAGSLYYLTQYSNIADKILIPNCVLLGSLCIFGAAATIYLLMKYVPGYYMHGYEAVYQMEKKRESTDTSVIGFIKNSLEGVIIIAKNPYVFGIFSIIFAYEIVIVIFDYLFALAVDSQNSTIGDLTAAYALQYFFMHIISLIIALFGTAPIQRFLGVRLSLFACPLISIIIMVITLIYPTSIMLFIALILLRALNYGLNHPTREALFIPTTKAVKFKSKAWTDAFGSRVAKASGSLLNKHILYGIANASVMFSLGVTAIWVIISHFLGKTFQKVIKANKVIGENGVNSNEATNKATN